MVQANPGQPRVQVHVATLPDASWGLRAWLDDRELERLAGYQGDADRARFLLGAAMLRAAVGSHLGVQPQDVPVTRRCAGCGRWHGRPAVPGTRLDLSVSHGGLLVVLALAVGGPVGVDVERVDGRPVSEIRTWTGAEARFKAGGDQALRVQELPTPVAGHVLTLAAVAGALVQVVPAAELLAGARTDRPAGHDRRALSTARSTAAGGAVTQVCR
jgi:4'-phosphopantetheinyl transferase